MHVFNFTSITRQGSPVVIKNSYLTLIRLNQVLRLIINILFYPFTHINIFIYYNMNILSYLRDYHYKQLIRNIIGVNRTKLH